MSNDVYVEDFFKASRDNVSDGIITVFAGVWLGGTFNYQTSSVDNSGTITSIVYDGKGGSTPIVCSLDQPNSISRMACEVLLHSMGVDKYLDTKKLLDRSYTNTEVLSKLEELYRTIPNIDKTKFPDNFTRLRMPKIEKCLKVLENNNLSRSMLDKLKTDAESVGKSMPANSSEKLAGVEKKDNLNN